ncbi:hypothetical protein [Thalassobacillus devorans]|uniref:hypothetical protein n=1 Tax=Thalassobacillus devorans TaxID=279813 RepID=UPI0004B9A963|nr:hypothetical protein [Thalassobacillus devorans]
MEDIISDYIDITNTSVVEFDQKRGYIYKDEVYFVLPAYGREEVYQELQHACDFLSKAGMKNIVCPVHVSESRYQIKKNQRTYVIGKTNLDASLSIPASGHELARFHELGATYPYHLPSLSTYGQWKTLWGNRIDHFEGSIQQWHQQRPVGDMHRLWIDTAPYIIGVGENAIQYVQESEQETRHQKKDQATFTFDRYPPHSQRLLWFDQIRYDHPARDLAEALRYKLMTGRSTEEITAFFYDYHTRSPLSIFGLRLLYARLLFPVHLLDKYEEVYSHPFEENLINETKLLFKYQRRYEQQLKHFFHALGINTDELKIPVLDW